MNVPLFDAKREFDAHRDEYLVAAERVLTSGRYILGPEVEAFESEVAAYLGVRHAVSCASGTDALWLALCAAGVGRGDAVITSALTFFATASAILNVGATPVLCDIDPATYGIDARRVAEVLEGRSEVHRRVGVDVGRIKAIVPVHLYGQPADMAELMDLGSAHGLTVIEDAAQSFGAEYGEGKAGTIGDLGCYSFFPTKTLGAFGDGGLVSSNDDWFADRVRMLRNHGGTSKFHNLLVGTNSRLDALQAAMLRVRLAHVDEAIAGRTRAADLYDSLLAGSNVATPKRAPGRTHVFGFYVVRVPDRDRVLEELMSSGIGATVHNPIPVHLQPAIPVAHVKGDLPLSEEAAAEIISMPTFPHIREDEIEAAAAALKDAVAKRRAAV